MQLSFKTVGASAKKEKLMMPHIQNIYLRQNVPRMCSIPSTMSWAKLLEGRASYGSSGNPLGPPQQSD